SGTPPDQPAPLTRCLRTSTGSNWTGSRSATGSGRPRPFATHLLDVLQRGPEVGQPGVFVLTDKPDAPGERVAATARHASVDQSVEHRALVLAEPGHHRDRKCRVHHSPVA